MDQTKFNIGQQVSFIDDNLEGVVAAIDGNLITLETDDGFLMKVDENELVSNHSMGVIDLPEEVIEDVKKTDLSPKKSFRKLSKKEKTAPPMEVDLHIHHLVDNQKGMTNYEMLNLQLDTARNRLEFAIKKRIQKVVFIHGVGEGVLRMELETLFSRYEQVKFYDADFRKYGAGATEVYIFQNVP